MCEANVGEEIVRQMCDAVELVANQPHVDAVKAFAVDIMAAVASDAEGASGTAYETFNTIVAALSPAAKDYATPNNQYGTEMAKQLAWIRSKDATEMMSRLTERMAECSARGAPGTVARDDDMASPARARARIDVTATGALAVIDGTAVGVPRLPAVDEDAGVTTTAQDAAAAPAPVEPVVGTVRRPMMGAAAPAGPLVERR